MTIDTLTTKILDGIAKTKREASTRGGLMIGFTLGVIAFTSTPSSIPGLIAWAVIVNIILFLGACLIIRGIEPSVTSSTDKRKE